MKISIISNYTFSSSLPEDTLAVHQYGSESMTSILASLLHKDHEVHFYAPFGSSRIGIFHPLRRTDGTYLPSDLLEDISLDNSKHLDLLDSFVIDCTPWANNVEALALYNDFNNYLSYRLGYKDYTHPKMLPPERRHYITHCNSFAELYKKAGFDCQVAHFGLNPAFWGSQDGNPDISHFGLETKAYFLFPHRYNSEKGSLLVLRLAEEFPRETFVFSSVAATPDHKAALQALRTKAPNNVKFVQIPSLPTRDYYRRALYQHAKATLSPFIANAGYFDTGGILSMESILGNTPVIVTRSEASEEILGHQENNGVFFSDGYDSLKTLIKYVDFRSTLPVPWIWTQERYAKEYMKAIDNILN